MADLRGSGQYGSPGDPRCEPRGPWERRGLALEDHLFRAGMEVKRARATVAECWLWRLQALCATIAAVAELEIDSYSGPLQGLLATLRYGVGLPLVPWPTAGAEGAKTEDAMEHGVASEHWTDADGQPAGGNTYGVGFAIGWQHGPLGREPNRRPPNGAFVEDVLRACADRLEFYQTTRFASIYNAAALLSIKSALEILHARSAEREARGVEGTHGV